MSMLFELSLLAGVFIVSSNPSPYYAALGLVVVAGVGCLGVMGCGFVYLSLVLFLVYLGGMMVVFGYSAALTAEPYPGVRGDKTVVVYLVLYLVWVFAGLAGELFHGRVGGGGGVYCVTGDWWGVSSLYSEGGLVLMVCGWALLLTLFVVLEVVRGHYSGVLRAV
uniref:NADH-ubiquinone oxidoreductase chain 6 n=1 Tax=Sooglossus sechellensis TaxID=356330 RepID=K9JZ11_SOOSE|nr:NADH dehydrogenase subunit 6 [Sooglossus sechellensis]